MRRREWWALTTGVVGLWALCGGVSMYGAQVAMRAGAIRTAIPLDMRVVVVTQATPWWVAMLLTPCVVLGLARLISAGRLARVSGVGMLAAGYIYAYLLIGPVLGQWIDGAKVTWPGAQVSSTRALMTSVTAFLQFCVIGGVVAAGVAAAHARDRRREVTRLARATVELERDLAAATLQVLRQQLQPHFLFNALHTVSSLIDSSPAAARDALARLADLLRTSLSREHRPDAPLGDELDFVDRYLSVDRARFGDRLAVRYEIAADVLGLTAPTFLLQPLVENAVRHGVARLEAGGLVTIGASVETGRLVVRIANDAPLDEVTAGQGLGLRQTRIRLATLYGESWSLHAGPDGSGRYLTVVTWPARPHEARS